MGFYDVQAQQDELFYRTFPDARHPPPTQVVIDHFRMYAPPDRHAELITDELRDNDVEMDGEIHLRHGATPVGGSPKALTMASRAELPVYADSELSAAICEHHPPTTVGEQDRSTSSLLTQDPIPASSDHGHELQPVKGKGKAGDWPELHEREDS
ncbi:hypothetical protein R3P38DRAFT_3179524 [Favolaschia claudopus]|uniref:Uncharacterized protein n=1 Tax=Favolaschia claudopus TaxID=2862362 RepID=A0AAW0CQT3_9AGAR